MEEVIKHLKEGKAALAPVGNGVEVLLIPSTCVGNFEGDGNALMVATPEGVCVLEAGSTCNKFDLISQGLNLPMAGAVQKLFERMSQEQSDNGEEGQAKVPLL